jgi:nucleoside-diphosphate-sugar epimerase
MKVLVTGSRGFVGCHLVKQLVEQGLKVVAFSRMSPEPIDLDFLKPVIESVEFVTGDLNDNKVWDSLFDKYKIDGIIHSAAVNGEAQARKYPDLAMRTNVAGTLELLIAANKARIKKFVYVGSGAQYGPRTDLTPLKEDDHCSPKGIYPNTKQATEMMGIAYSKLSCTKFISVRISAPYGPMDRIDPAPSHIKYWCNAALMRIPVNLVKGGDHRRDFTYIEDAAKGIIALYLADSLSSPVYNISSGKSYSLWEVIATLNKRLPDANLQIGEGLLEVNHPQVENSYKGPLDITRAATEVHFTPSYTLEEGIKKYIAWLMHHPY